jgi:hypothetical protein
VAKGKTVYIDVIVDDKGTVERMAIKQKNLNKALDQTGRKTKLTTQQLKGIGQQSSNSSKNFSKLEGSMGGVVGAYASLAAQLFAISAAFSFLKSAGDMKAMQAGQQIYAESTGLAMRTLTNDIIKATDAQISFADASQAAAIGNAAGLQASQLTQLGAAAKAASAVLGRDVTDSFNRLIRGVTKAEPELLDELGIILRLETAQKNYANSLGISAKDLTQFQKTQAVANEVLQQANDKYVAVTAGVEGTTNVYNQLGKAFDDVIMSIKAGVDLVAAPIAHVLIKIPMLAIAAMGLLIRGPLAAMGVSFGSIALAAKKSADVQNIHAAKLRANMMAARVTVKSVTAALREQAVATLALGAKSKILTRLAEGGMLTNMDKGRLRASILKAGAQMHEYQKVKTGMFKGASKEILADYKLLIKQLDLQNKKAGLSFKIMTTTSAAYWASFVGVMRTGMAAIATGAMWLLSAFGWISLAVTAALALNEKFKWWGGESPDLEAAKVDALTDRIKGLNEEYEGLLETQLRLIEAGSKDAIGVQAKQLEMLDLNQFTKAIELYGDYNKVIEHNAQLEKAQKAVNSGNVITDPGMRGIRRRKILDMDPEEVTGHQQTAADMFERQKNEIEGIRDAMGFLPKAAQAYLDVLKNGGTVEEILKAKEAYVEVGGKITALKTIAKDAEDAFGAYGAGLAGVSAAETALNKVIIAQKALQTAIDNGSRRFGGPEENKEEDMLQRRIDMLTEQLNIQSRIAISKERLSREQALQNALALSWQKDSIKANQTLATNVQERDALEEKVAERIRTQAESGVDVGIGYENNLALLREQLLTADQLVQTSTALAILEAELFQIKRSIYSLGLTQDELKQETELMGMLEKELGFRSQILANEEKLQKLAQEREFRDERSNNMFAFLDEAERSAKAAYTIEKSLIADKQLAIEQEAKIKSQQIELEYALLDAKMEQTRFSLLAIREKAKVDGNGDSVQSIDKVLGTLKTQQGMLAGMKQGALEVVGSDKETALATLLNNLDKLREAKDEFNNLRVIQKDFAESFSSNMSSAFDSIVTGTSTVKDAFRGMAVNILESLSKVITQMLIIKLIQGAMGFGASTFGIGAVGSTAAATGTSLISGGYKPPSFPMMATGGVAEGAKSGYPAVLHGTEAVVPLPNGKSIPVEMKNSSSSNSVTVNVAIDGNGSSSNNSTQDSNQMGNLGNAIAQAVQKELQNQKRAGGILSPYGVA